MVVQRYFNPEHFGSDEEMQEYANEHPPRWYSVGICLEDRACGGSEEGGWWFTYGVPANEHGIHTKVFKTEDEAWAYHNELEATICAELNKGRRPMSSVLSNGEFHASIFEEEYPAAWPKVRPHYE